MLEIVYEYKDDIGTFYTLPIKTSQLYVWETDPNINVIKIYKFKKGIDN